MGKGGCGEGWCYWSHFGSRAEGGLAWSAPRVHSGMGEIAVENKRRTVRMQARVSGMGTRLVAISLSWPSVPHRLPQAGVGHVRTSGSVTELKAPGDVCCLSFGTIARPRASEAKPGA